MLTLASRAPCRRGTIMRHGDDARHQAAEKPDDEIEPGRKDQQRPVARPAAGGKPRRDRGGAAMQLAKGQRCFDGAAIGQEQVAAILGLG